MAEKNPDAAAQTMVSVVQFAALVELTVQRVYQLCRQDRSPRPISKTDLQDRPFGAELLDRGGRVKRRAMAQSFFT